MKHTPEPWKLCNLKYKIITNDGYVIAEVHPRIAQITESTKADAQRIVSCVNALSGIEDVEGFVEKIQEHLTDLRKWSNAWQIKLEANDITAKKAFDSVVLGIDEITTSALSLLPTNKEPS